MERLQWICLSCGRSVDDAYMINCGHCNSVRENPNICEACNLANIRSTGVSNCLICRTRFSLMIKDEILAWVVYFRNLDNEIRDFLWDEDRQNAIVGEIYRILYLMETTWPLEEVYGRIPELMQLLRNFVMNVLEIEMESGEFPSFIDIAFATGRLRQNIVILGDNDETNELWDMTINQLWPLVEGYFYPEVIDVDQEDSSNDSGDNDVIVID